MKSIVLCEPSYGDKGEDEKTSDKLSKNRAGNTETSNDAMSDGDVFSDIEICQVITTIRNGAEEVNAEKQELNVSERKKSPPDEFASGDICSEKTVNVCVSHGDEKREAPRKVRRSSKLFLRDDETGRKILIEDVNCVLNCATNGASDSVPVENVTKDLKQCRRVENDNCENERCTVDGNDLVISEINLLTGGTISNIDEKRMSTRKKEKIELDRRIAEIGSHSSEKECNDEVFIEEEEENKENRRTDERSEVAEREIDTRRRDDCIRKDSLVECTKSTRHTAERLKSNWEEGKSEFYGPNNINETECLVETEMKTVENCVREHEKNRRITEIGKKGSGSLSEGSNAANSETKVRQVQVVDEEGEIESCPEIIDHCDYEGGSRAEDEAAQKRKRLLALERENAAEGEEAVSKKRRKTKGHGKGGENSSSRSNKAAALVGVHASNENLEGHGKPEKEYEKTEEEEISGSRGSKLGESMDGVASASAQVTLPFLETLRGTIKTLSRADLEELIVQKLCEVITERSEVGDLRRKAQALERDQERWKDKVQSLTKQLREMDMVMKKYMDEVHKQNKERNFPMVAPLRVTRSVGLQVSFGSSSSKLNKALQNNSQTKQSPSVQAQDNLVKQSVRPAASSPNSKKNSAIPPGNQKKKPGAGQKSTASRTGTNATYQAHLISQSVATSSRTPQSQVNAVNRPKAPMADQNNSKVIDLTEDDDRQSSQNGQKPVLQPSIAVRPPGQIRVVNQIQPAPVSSAGRVAYLVPATPTATACSQGRQLLLATPTVQTSSRQLLPTVPPLLYKGSGVVQSGAQQATIINQPNRAILAKPLKHPAPLPQPPANQIQKSNLKLMPPRPALKISKVQTGIVLSWNMTLGPEYEPIASYQLYAYQENNSPPATSLWKKVGDVKALPLPMACTLTQFMSGHKYYFAVRAVDLHSRIGPFSFPGSIVLIK